MLPVAAGHSSSQPVTAGHSWSQLVTSSDRLHCSRHTHGASQPLDSSTAEYPAPSPRPPPSSSSPRDHGSAGGGRESRHTAT